MIFIETMGTLAEMTLHNIDLIKNSRKPSTSVKESYSEVARTAKNCRKSIERLSIQIAGLDMLTEHGDFVVEETNGAKTSLSFEQLEALYTALIVLEKRANLVANEVKISHSHAYDLGVVQQLIQQSAWHFRNWLGEDAPVSRNGCLFKICNVVAETVGRVPISAQVFEREIKTKLNVKY